MRAVAGKAINTYQDRNDPKDQQYESITPLSFRLPSRTNGGHDVRRTGGFDGMLPYLLLFLGAPGNQCAQAHFE